MSTTLSFPSHAARLPTLYGEFRIWTVLDGSLEHVVVMQPAVTDGATPLVRVHSECYTGDVLRSLRCDCSQQLHMALERIGHEGGVLIYLRQEGRGIGLAQKLAAYQLQDNGRDTVEANIELGLPVDAREYVVAGRVLSELGLTQIRLMTNNPKKIVALAQQGVVVVDRVPIEVEPNQHNTRYLQTKKEKLGHLLSLFDRA